MIPEPPAGNILAWAMANPAALRDAVQLLNQLAALRTTLTRPTQAKDQAALLIAPDRTLLQLPLQFSSAVAAPTGGATVDTECRIQLTALLSRLSELGLNK